MLSSTVRPKLLALLLVCLGLALVAPAGASAAAGAGTVTLAVGGKGKAAKALTAAGVKTGAIRPAKKRGARLVLPVASLTVGKSAKVALRGGIAFRAGRRAAKLKSVQLVVSGRRATVSAKLGGARKAFFTASLPVGKTKLDRSKLTAAVTGGRLALTKAGARALRAKLGVAGIVAGKLGTLAADARPAAGSGGGGGGTPGGGPGGGGPTAGPIKNEPPVLARPAGAVDVTSASLSWRPRVSWLCYVEESNVFGGATNGPVETLDCPTGPPRDLVATFQGFPFKNGWYDPATGTAAIYFQGGVGFKYASHGINFSSANPEIEIKSGASRAIFTFNGSDGTKYDNQRGVLVDLHPNPIQNPPNGTVTYTDVPATVPADAGASVFAGFYGANEEFGSMSVSFTTP